MNENDVTDAGPGNGSYSQSIETCVKELEEKLITEIGELNDEIKKNRELIKSRIKLEIGILDNVVSLYERFLQLSFDTSEDEKTANRARDYSRYFERTLGKMGVLINSLKIGEIVDESNAEYVEVIDTMRAPEGYATGEIYEAQSANSYSYNGEIFKRQRVSIYKE